MRCVEYGEKNRDVILLLHGGGLSWWSYRDAAEALARTYHVVLPILDGHAGSDEPFTTIERNADAIISYIDAHFGGSVLLIGGLSLGGQILLEMLARRKDVCKYAIVESALVMPSRLTHALIKPTFGGCYGLIKHRWFAKLQFKSLRIKPELFDLYFRDTCAISKRDMISFLEANSRYALKNTVGACVARTYILVGEKENRAMQRSAKCIHKAIKGSELQILLRCHHGEFSINHGAEYADTVKALLADR